MEEIDFSKFKNSCELFNHMQVVNKRYITPEEFKPISKKYQEYKQSIKIPPTKSSINSNKTKSNSSEEKEKKQHKKRKHRKTLITDEVYNQILEMDDESGYKLFLTKMKLN